MRQAVRLRRRASRLDAAKPLVIERVSSTLRIEGRQEPLGQAYLAMSADDDWGDSVRIDLGIQDARLLSGWLGSWLRNKA